MGRREETRSSLRSRSAHPASPKQGRKRSRSSSDSDFSIHELSTPERRRRRAIVSDGEEEETVRPRRGRDNEKRIKTDDLSRQSRIDPFSVRSSRSTRSGPEAGPPPAAPSDPQQEEEVTLVQEEEEEAYEPHAPRKRLVRRSFSQAKERDDILTRRVAMLSQYKKDHMDSSYHPTRSGTTATSGDSEPVRRRRGRPLGSFRRHKTPLGDAASGATSAASSMATSPMRSKRGAARRDEPTARKHSNAVEMGKPREECAFTDFYPDLDPSEALPIHHTPLAYPITLYIMRTEGLKHAQGDVIASAAAALFADEEADGSLADHHL